MKFSLLYWTIPQCLVSFVGLVPSDSFVILIRHSLALLLPMLLTVAYFTLAERKAMASMQRRIGPNMTGFWGVLQPISDGVALLITDIVIPGRANHYLFLSAPIAMFTISFTLFTVIPFSYQTVFMESDYSLLLFFTISSLNVYSVVVAGWASNSRYALLGSVRAMAQMLSYELVFSMLILVIYLVTGTLRFADIVAIQEQYGHWLIVPFFPIAVIFFITMLAETNRAPFDLSEAESELVAGYHVEYSGILFAFFFIGEYCSMLAMSTVFSIIFLGGWLPVFKFFLWWLPPTFFLAAKTVFMCFMFIFIRALVPRYRFDQLLTIGWRTLLPLTFGFFMFYLGYMWYTRSLPYTSPHFINLPDDLPTAEELDAIEGRPKEPKKTFKQWLWKEIKRRAWNVIAKHPIPYTPYFK